MDKEASKPVESSTDMKNNALATVLLAVLAFSALGSVILCYMNIKYSREFRSLQIQVNQLNNNRNIMSALANDALEYSKKNPAIDPILEAAGIKPKTASAATNKPASK